MRHGGMRHDERKQKLNRKPGRPTYAAYAIMVMGESGTRTYAMGHEKDPTKRPLTKVI